MLCVATDNRCKLSLGSRRHNISATCELRSATVYCLMYSSTLEEMVALVCTATGVEEGEYAGNKQ